MPHHTIRSFSACVIAGVLLSSSALSFATAKSAEPILFVQTAKTATLRPKQAGASRYTLTLKKVNPLVLWFADRPGRTAGTLGMQQFISAWDVHSNNSFKLDHPNAALVSVSVEKDDSPKRIAPVFTLSQPTYNAAKHSIQYRATPVNGSAAVTHFDFKDVAVMVDYSSYSLNHTIVPLS